MLLSRDALFTTLHGIVLGGLFLLAFSGGLIGLYSLSAEYVTFAGFRKLLTRLIAGIWIMAIVAWLTVITGTYFVYPPYRAQPSKGASLSNYPKAYLQAHPNLAVLDSFGMEWKEHLAWMAPMLATAVAYIVVRYGPRVVSDVRVRRALLVLFTITFLIAAIAGMIGVFLNKAAPL